MSLGLRVSAVAMVAAALTASVLVLHTSARAIARAAAQGPAPLGGPCRGVAHAVGAGAAGGRPQARPPAVDGMVGLAGLTRSGTRHAHSPTDPLVRVEVANGDARTAAEEFDLLLAIRGDGDVSLAGCVARDTADGRVVEVPVHDARPDLPVLLALDSVARGGALYNEPGMLAAAPVFEAGSRELAVGPRLAGGKPAVGGVIVQPDGAVLVERGRPSGCEPGCRPVMLAVFDLRPDGGGNLVARRVHQDLVGLPVSSVAVPLARPRPGTLRVAVVVGTFADKFVVFQSNRLL